MGRSNVLLPTQVLQYAYEYQEGKGGPGLDHIIFLNNLHLYFFVSKFTLPTPPPTRIKTPMLPSSYCLLVRMCKYLQKAK